MPCALVADARLQSDAVCLPDAAVALEVGKRPLYRE